MTKNDSRIVTISVAKSVFPHMLKSGENFKSLEKTKTAI